MAESIVIVGAKRTPIGSMQGKFNSVTASQLGSGAIKAAIEQAGVKPTEVDDLIFGNVLGAGQGQAPARQASLGAGLPLGVGCTTINKMCGSAMKATMMAADELSSGNATIVVAGGMESMTNAPHLLPKSRQGYKFGSVELLDSMAFDGLTDPFDHLAMGESTEHHNGRLNIGREEQDEFAARSHQRAALARKNGLFDDEIVAVPVAQRRGEPLLIGEDEGIRADTTVESLAKLRPAFGAEGTITAGSSSQISDGACALLVTSRQIASERGWTVLAEIGAHGVVAGPDNSLHSQPSRAIARALEREEMSVDQVDLFEINEAFAAVAIQSMRELKVDAESVNVNGGAIALGHPIGMSGARLALHLIYELRRRGGGVGVAGLCGGSGQGDALVLRVASA